MLNFRNFGYQVVIDVIVREGVNFDYYGIDEEGFVFDVQSDYVVFIFDIIIILIYNQELLL